MRLKSTEAQGGWRGNIFLLNSERAAKVRLEESDLLLLVDPLPVRELAERLPSHLEDLLEVGVRQMFLDYNTL